MDNSQRLRQPQIQDGPGKGESNNEFFQRFLHQSQPLGGNSPPFTNPPVPLNRVNGPMDQQPQRPTDLEPNMQNMNHRTIPPDTRSQHSGPVLPPFNPHSPPPA